MSLQKRDRLWEIDAIRGAAVLAMIVFHLRWDLWFLGLSCGRVREGLWDWAPTLIGGTFFLLLGICVRLDSQKAAESGISPVRRAFKRGLCLFIFALGISGVTYWMLQGDYIRFGVLHFAAIAVPVATLFAKLRPLWNVIVGCDILAIGFCLDPIPSIPLWLSPLGLVSTYVEPTDYWPFVPWFGVVLLGLAIGQFAYGPTAKRRFSLPEWGEHFPIDMIQWLGRHSLAIYLTHQPLLLGSLKVLIWLGLTGYITCKRS